MELTDQSAIKSEHEKSSARDGDDKSFSLGERVLASHNHILYEAKVIEIAHKNNQQKFHVHYRGWKDKYNEWVTIDRLLKHNEENLKLLEKIYKQHEASKQKKTTSHLKARHASGKGKKRKFGTVHKTEIADWGKAVDIRVPQSLRKQLSQDCELVAQMGELVNLPCSPNVEEILHMYIDNRLKNGEELVDSLIEIMKGLHNYFDKALPAMLLYKNERQQYQQFTANQVPPSKVYGAEHLLRLLVKLPELLYNANIEEATLGELKDKLQDFLTFLQEKQSTFFVSTTSKFAETSTEDNKVATTMHNYPVCVIEVPHYLESMVLDCLAKLLDFASVSYVWPSKQSPAPLQLLHALCQISSLIEGKCLKIKFKNRTGKLMPGSNLSLLLDIL